MSFLQYVAQDLLQRHHGDLSQVTIILPNKRARLFLNEALLSLAKQPTWEPHYITSSDLFAQLSGSSVSDPIPAIATLYDLYSQQTGPQAESIDQFWGWGEILLSDFDDIDKHLVDAKSLFSNAKDLAHMETLDYLEPTQLEALKQFFSNFTTNYKTHIQQRFIQLWSIMPALYDGLKTSMPPHTYPYEGAMQRAVIEDHTLLASIPQDREYNFVGFNMLSETDKALMQYLHRRHQAKFYWDYDHYYLDDPNSEAGEFIRQNLKHFPNQLTSANGYDQSQLYDNIRHKQHLTYVSTSTDTIGTRYIPQWLTTHLTTQERQTAILLCDEDQLETVLHSIPDQGSNAPHDLNITMGFPLKATPIYSLIIALTTLQTEGWDPKRQRFRRPYLQTINNHPYAPYLDQQDWQHPLPDQHIDTLISYLDHIVIKIATATVLSQESEATPGPYDILMTESIYTTHKTLNYLHDITTSTPHPIKLLPATMRRLLRHVLTTRTIPFSGEPASGLQVMGVLETRLLDFTNILMLNVGEGHFPKLQSDTTLIPNTLRTGFHLTTTRHRIAVYAYYFYRLLQRAEHITFLYNENSTGIQKNEISRFLRQLQAESTIPLRTIRLTASQHITTTPTPDYIDKTPSIIQALHQMYDTATNTQASVLTPSSINRYITCPMQFYYSNICKLRIKEEQDTIGARELGSIFHASIEHIYKEIISHHRSTTTTHTNPNILTTADLSPYIAPGNTRLSEIIATQFRQVAGITDFRGETIIMRNVIEQYLRNTIRHDIQTAPIIIDAMEEMISIPLTIQNNDTPPLHLRVGGIVDRMDKVRDPQGEEYLRVLDYKTGARHDKPSTLQDLFADKEHSGYYLQAFLYAVCARHTRHYQGRVKPVLLYVNQANHTDYDPTLLLAANKTNETRIEDIADLEQEYIDLLTQKISQIFDPSLPFCKTSNTKVCEWCDYKDLCH